MQGQGMDDALDRPTQARVPSLPRCEFVHSSSQQLRQSLLQAPRSWLVTGAAGFIGSHLVEQLLALGQTVVGLDNYSTGYRSNIDDVLARQPGARHRLRMIEGDIRDLETCRAACHGVQYVLHQAALGSVPWSVADPATTNSVNVDGFVTMLVAARDAHVRRFVYASSSAVYGDVADYPQVEERVGRPLSPYAASKRVDELYAQAFGSTYGLATIGLRYFNVFGRRQDPDGPYAAVIPRWIASLLRHEPCRIFGDGLHTRDFCHVDNVVLANLLAATTNAPGAVGECYNVACARVVTVNELFALLRDHVATHDPGVSYATPSHEAPRAGDIAFSSAAIGKAQRLLGFSPVRHLADGLAESLDWYVPQARAPRLAVSHAS